MKSKVIVRLGLGRDLGSRTEINRQMSERQTKHSRPRAVLCRMRALQGKWQICVRAHAPREFNFHSNAKYTHNTQYTRVLAVLGSGGYPSNVP